MNYQSGIYQGMRSSFNILAISLLAAYLSAYILILFVPLFLAVLIPTLILYFVAPKLTGRSQAGVADTTFTSGRRIGLAIGLLVGLLGIAYSLGPVLDAVNANAVGDGASIANQSVSVVANIAYVIAFAVGYFRSI